MALSQTSSTETYMPHVGSNPTSMPSRHPKQLDISFDLYRAIEELRSVPVLRWPDEVTLNDSVSGDVVDRAERINQSVMSNHAETTTDVTLSGGSCTVQARWGQSTATNTSIPVALAEKPGSKHTHVEAPNQSWSIEEQSPASDCLSDSVFVDVATPIDADLLIDDVYEREMDELDQLEVEMIAAYDPQDWPDMPSESANDVFNRFTDSANVQSSTLLTESFTDRLHSTENTAGCGFPPDVSTHCASMHPESVYISSTVSSFVDTSAEELFEEIVESMTDRISEDGVEIQEETSHRLTEESSPTKSSHDQLETTVDSRLFAADDCLASPVQPPTWPSNHLSRSEGKREQSEQKRQTDMTICLSSTLNDCLRALTKIDTSVGRSVERHNRKCDTTNSDDVIFSWLSTKSPRTDSSPDESRHCVTSSSSGFQSDLVDVDIDQEFDANADIEATRPICAESTSLDSLLELNDEDESYSTIIRRPIPSPLQRSNNHSTVSAFVANITPQTVVQTDTCVTSTDRAEGTRTTEGDKGGKQNGNDNDKEDDMDKKTVQVVTYDENSPMIEVLAEELITQEIVLNIVLPRRSKKTIGFGLEETMVVRSFQNRWKVASLIAGGMTERLIETFIFIGSYAAQTLQITPTKRRKDRRVSRILMPWKTAISPSLVSRYVGGTVSVELERNAESTSTEQVDDDTRLHVTRRNRFKVLRAPDGSGAALFNAPVTSVNDVVERVGQTLVGDQPLPRGVRITCDAVERKSSTSVSGDAVTVVHRDIYDDSKEKRSNSTT